MKIIEVLFLITFLTGPLLTMVIHGDIIIHHLNKRGNMKKKRKNNHNVRVSGLIKRALQLAYEDTKTPQTKIADGLLSKGLEKYVNKAKLEGL